MINSLIHPRVPLSKLPIEEPSSPFKRKAKIFTKKLPEDFFRPRMTPLESQRSITSSHRNYIHTQDQTRKIPLTQRSSQTRGNSDRIEDASMKKLFLQSNTMNLFLGIIKSTRQIKRTIRKHSLQLQKGKLSSNNENMRVELPPLLLKKGITALF